MGLKEEDQEGKKEKGEVERRHRGRERDSTMLSVRTSTLINRVQKRHRDATMEGS